MKIRIFMLKKELRFRPIKNIVFDQEKDFFDNYKEVFKGQVECNNLDELFVLLNNSLSYMSISSLSVSDIIEDTETNRFYYIDINSFVDITDKLKND